jgi:hypothetical protein
MDRPCAAACARKTDKEPARRKGKPEKEVAVANLREYQKAEKQRQRAYEKLTDEQRQRVIAAQSAPEILAGPTIDLPRDRTLLTDATVSAVTAQFNSGESAEEILKLVTDTLAKLRESVH